MLSDSRMLTERSTMEPSVLTTDEENCSSVSARPDDLAVDAVRARQRWPREGLLPLHTYFPAIRVFFFFIAFTFWSVR